MPPDNCKDPAASSALPLNSLRIDGEVGKLALRHSPQLRV